MISMCAKCGKLLEEGQRVKAEVEATYHVLKSSIAFALDREDMSCDARSLRHVRCYEGD